MLSRGTRRLVFGMFARHAEDNRVLDDNRVISEAISASDTAPAAVTIKLHNRTIALDHGRTHPAEGRRPGINAGSPSSMCPNTSSNAPKLLRTDRPKPLYVSTGHLINSLCAELAVRNAGSGCLRAPRQ